MAALEKQPTLLPTRKIAAVIISGAVCGALQSAAAIFFPDAPFQEILEQIDIYVQASVMAFFGYMVRERAK